MASSSPRHRPGPRRAEIRFLGRIAAGKPIEAVRDEETLAVPTQLLRGPHGDHFVLRVVGDSMIEEGIQDGDLVVVQRRDTATTGDMVVALVDEEATLKRFYPEGERYACSRRTAPWRRSSCPPARCGSRASRSA